LHSDILHAITEGENYKTKFFTMVSSQSRGPYLM